MNAAVDRLAHEINNPLQSLTNSLYLATVEREGPTPRIDEANRQLIRISSLARDVLRSANLK